MRSGQGRTTRQVSPSPGSQSRADLSPERSGEPARRVYRSRHARRPVTIAGTASRPLPELPPMPAVTRRDFLAASALTLSAATYNGAAAKPNDRHRLAVMGTRVRGKQLI